MLGSSHIVAFAAATDLHRARAFYEQVLGLPVAEHNDFACVLDANQDSDGVWTAPGGDRVAWFTDPDAMSCRSPSSFRRSGSWLPRRWR
jgi:hypothetical protein